jgi:electron-transferring-flavoprotein dehydrogenase
MSESMQYDIVIVGGGTAGLSAAIHIKQLQPTLSVCLLEKGAEIGAHILSGAILEPSSLTALLPDWQARNAPVTVPVKQEQLHFFSHKKNYQIPSWLMPKTFDNHGNYIISLAALCRWLAQQAEALGVDIFTGYTANNFCFNNENKITGIITGELGIAKDGSQKPAYVASMTITAKWTLLAEGCRGFLSEQVIKKYQLNANRDPQTYGIGIKEIWEVPANQHQLGCVQHTFGWPLDRHSYGGGFVYHAENNQIALGFVLGLDYKNPYCDPYQEMQRWKTHPLIAKTLQHGKRIAYGARCLNEGGLQSLPQLIFPGGALIGCAAGFLDVAKIKGIHNAIRSGMLAAKAIQNANDNNHDHLTAYPVLLSQSYVQKELHQTRNFRRYFKKFGLYVGAILAGIDVNIFKGKVPYTLHHQHDDRTYTKQANIAKKILYPKADGILTFSRMDSVYLANTHHDENQPCHLHLRDKKKLSTAYATPEQWYCPAGVYELVNQHLHIHAANCIHCKACDIKDPLNNIVWTLPEGGSGPNYPNM